MDHTMLHNEHQPHKTPKPFLCFILHPISPTPYCAKRKEKKRNQTVQLYVSLIKFILFNLTCHSSLWTFSYYDQIMQFSRLFDTLLKFCLQASVHEMKIKCLSYLFYRIDTKVNLDRFHWPTLHHLVDNCPVISRNYFRWPNVRAHLCVVPTVRIGRGSYTSPRGRLLC